MLWPLIDGRGRPAGRLEGYQADTGEDIGCEPGTILIAPAAGQELYAERGHTSWMDPPDTPNSILFELAEPLMWKGEAYGLLWFTHLRKLFLPLGDGHEPHKVRAGVPLGETGLGNRVPHLHMGVLRNRRQGPGDYLPQWEVQALLRQVLAAPKPPAIWQHPDGLHVAHEAIYGLKWPAGTHHVYLVADGRWTLYHGAPRERIRLAFTQGGKRELQAVAYDAGNREIARDDLTITVK